MDTTVSARIDSKVKKEAESVFSQLGITHTVAINALYAQVVLTRGLPFELRIPQGPAPTFPEIRRAVRDAARQAGVERVWLFGSHARGQAGPGSDVDLLVSAGECKGLVLGGFQQDLEGALGVPVDVTTTGSVSESFRSAIREDEVLLYER